MSSQVRIQPDSGRLVAGPLQLADLAQCRLADLVRQVGLLDPGPVVVRAVRLVLAELLADRGELLAQQELALALLHALAHVVADLLGDLQLGQVLAAPADEPLESGVDVARLQQPSFWSASSYGA